MVRSTQTNPNEIQLDDISKDEDMEERMAWEENNLAPLEVVEEGANVAPQAKRNKEELEPIVQIGIERAMKQAKVATFHATMTS
ncbi:unnamed protein product [Sphagnum balticum]